MAVEISDKLSNWISQSESYQTFLDFDMSKENIANYTIINKFDDFYITLFSLAFDIFNNVENLHDQKIIHSIAKGFDTYVYNKSAVFDGINKKNSLLQSASLRLLAGFSSTATLIANELKISDFENDQIKQLLLMFLKKELGSNELSVYLINFINSGDNSELDQLDQIILKEINSSIDNDPEKYLSCVTLKAILHYFKVHNIWNKLRAIDSDIKFWHSYASYNLSNNIWYYFPSQIEAIDQGMIQSSQSFSMQMPTSSGKTALCELLIYYHYKKNSFSKIILLAPFRALASELKYSMGTRLFFYGINTKSLYGGSLPTYEERQSIENANLLIITPEKMMAIEDVYPDILNNISLVICDEGHLIDDPNRGFDYELFLTRLKISRKDNIRFVYLSAIVPNIDDINSWLGGSKKSVAYSDFKPASIDFALVKKYNARNSKDYYLDINPFYKEPKDYQLYGFIYKKDYQYKNSSTNRLKTYPFYQTKKAFSISCALKTLSSGLVALFAPTKKSNGVAGLCEEMIKHINAIKEYNLNVNLPISYCDKSYLKLLEEYFAVIFNNDYLLLKCVQNGFVYHHGSLPQYIRDLVEYAVRKEKVRLVICTNTLAEGVNLPLKTMVIHTLKRQIGEKWHKLKIRDVKNLIGRVGRAGKEKKGYIIVPNVEDIFTIKNAIDSIDLEPVRGFLYQIVELITKNLSKIDVELSNELIEAQKEDFLRLIDSIDSAIFDLISDDITIATLNEISQTLVESTFSYKQSDNDKKKVLKQLVNLRSNAIAGYVDDDSLPRLKRSGSNLRIFLEIKDKVNFDNDIWLMSIEPIDQQWIDFIFEQVAQLNYMQYEMDSYKFKDIVTFKELKDICLLWMNGKQYGEISQAMNIEIDSILDILNDLINYKLANIISKIIRIREQYIEDDESINENILDWPQFLQYGINTRVKLLLIQLGFTERIGLWCLSEKVERLSEKIFDDENELKSFIIGNKQLLLETIKDEIPILSYNEIKKNIKFIENYNW